jgi:hypothetical protein
MYFELRDSSGGVVQSGYADENGYTFTGLDPSATYYVYPVDCNGCHGSTHDVVFDHWGDGNTARPRAATVGSSLDAWYSCTNGCGGNGPSPQQPPALWSAGHANEGKSAVAKNNVQTQLVAGEEDSILARLYSHNVQASF